MVMPRLFDLPALQKTCGQRSGWTADKTLSVAQERYDGDGKKLITYPRAEARYLTENQISGVPAIVAALTRLRGFAQLEIAPPVIRRASPAISATRLSRAFRIMPSSPISAKDRQGFTEMARAPERIATRTRLL